MVILMLLACGSDQQVSQTLTPNPQPEPEPEPVSELEDLDPLALLNRASLDFRGVRPTIQEMEEIEASPDAYGRMLDSFMRDERFGDRVRSMFSDIYLTRQDYYYVSADDFGINSQVDFVESIGDEPLQILSYIAMNDRPYYEIVTAEWSMANETLAQAFPVDYPEGGSGWQQVQYTDGRPMAGILSTNGMWWRYTTTASNANRGRANAITRILLCENFLSRPIEFSRDVNLLDEEAIREAIQTNPGCVACHSTLDPIGSYLYGFYYYDYYSHAELDSYHAEREELWSTYTETEPSYYGEPGYTIADLGQQIADDARLPQCITEQVYEVLLQRDVALADTEDLTAHREALLQNEMKLKSLFRSVALSDEYRKAMDAEGETRTKMLSPDQFGSVIEDLTGFRFTYSGYDLLKSETYGVRTLAGGVDGVYATVPAEAPTATMILVHQRIAEAAAWYVVEHDAESKDADRLFTAITFAETPDTDGEAMAEQIQLLHLRLFGNRVELDGAEVTANLDLWRDLYAVEGDTRAAWAGLLSVLMRDPEFLFY